MQASCKAVRQLTRQHHLVAGSSSSSFPFAVASTSSSPAIHCSCSFSANSKLPPSSSATFSTTATNAAPSTRSRRPTAPFRKPRLRGKPALRPILARDVEPASAIELAQERRVIAAAAARDGKGKKVEDDEEDISNLPEILLKAKMTARYELPQSVRLPSIVAIERSSRPQGRTVPFGTRRQLRRMVKTTPLSQEQQEDSGPSSSSSLEAIQARRIVHRLKPSFRRGIHTAASSTMTASSEGQLDFPETPSAGAVRTDVKDNSVHTGSPRERTSQRYIQSDPKGKGRDMGQIQEAPEMYPGHVPRGSRPLRPIKLFPAEDAASLRRTLLKAREHQRTAAGLAELMRFHRENLRFAHTFTFNILLQYAEDVREYKTV